MKKIHTFFGIMLILCFSLVTIQHVEASEMKSDVGINFVSPAPAEVPDPVVPGGKLPATGELVGYSMALIGILFLLAILFLFWKKNKEERRET